MGNSMSKNRILKILLLMITLLIIIVISLLFLTKKTKKIEKHSNLEKTEISGELIDDDYKLEDSHITGEDIIVDTTYSIYYTFLNDEEKKLYKQIYANIINLKETFIPIVDMNKDQILKVYQFVTYDNPELFWLSNGFTYKHKDEICKQITLRFNGLQYEYEKNKKLFDDAVDSIVSEALNLSSDYEKESFVYNKIIKNTTYDLKSYYNQTAYSALVNHKTVCAGYSKAFQYIMRKLNIVTYFVVGVANKEDHAWNIIKLDDGYYNIDLTWEEINISDKEYASTHERGEYSELLPTCVGKNYLNTLNNANKSEKKQTTNNINQEIKQETKEIDNPNKTNVPDDTVEQNKIEIENKEIKEENIEEDSEYGKTVDVGDEVINYPYIENKKNRFIRKKDTHNID